MDVEAQDDGVLGKILVEGGSKNVQVGTTIAIIAEPGDELSGSEMDSLISEAKSSKPASSPPKKEGSSPPPKSEPTPALATKEEPQKAPESSKPKDVIFASPLAKKLAQEKGIPLSKVKGTGPGGRIVKADIDSYKPSESSAAASTSAASTTPAYTDIPLSNMRRVIGQRLLQSKVEIPHYYLTSEINMDRIIKLREVFNSAATAAKDGVKADTKLSVNDFIVKGAALAMKDVPEVNSGWFGDFIRQYHTVDISVAVATPTGLITPIIQDVGSKGLASISSTTKALAAKARDGKLQPSEYQGGSFTISNLGMFGSISHFTAIVNPPQSCILAIGGTEKKLVEDPTEEKGFKSVNSMKVTLSCDHRVVDGAVGARWLKAFKDYMENPLTFML